MKYEVNYGGTIIVAIIFFLLVGAAWAFGSETRHWEAVPYVDFNGTVHGGFGKHYDGFAGSVGIGFEGLAVVSDRFAVGVNAKTSATYDMYNTFPGSDMVVDEYGVWSFSIGPVMYVGDMFYLTVLAQSNLDVFYENTYVHSGNTDTEVDKLDYSVDDLDWWFEAGFRVDYHASIYLAANTHLVETSVNTSRYQLHCGLKFFF